MVRWLDWLYPPRCLLCGQPGADLCPGCEAELPLIHRPCQRCALPLNNNDQLCGRCLSKPPVYARGVSALHYAGAARELVLGLKHGRLTHGRVLTDLMLTRLAAAPKPSLIIPIPLHRQRLAQRGFNQAGVLAKRLGRALQVPVAHGLLHRQHNTPPQQGLDAAARRRNLRQAFTARRPLAGHVALVDDVVTTGATADAASRVLLKAGASEVSVWSCARTPDPRSK